MRCFAMGSKQIHILIVYLFGSEEWELANNIYLNVGLICLIGKKSKQLFNSCFVVTVFFHSCKTFVETDMLGDLSKLN